MELFLWSGNISGRGGRSGGHGGVFVVTNYDFLFHGGYNCRSQFRRSNYDEFFLFMAWVEAVDLSLIHI